MAAPVSLVSLVSVETRDWTVSQDSPAARVWKVVPEMTGGREPAVAPATEVAPETPDRSGTRAPGEDPATGTSASYLVNQSVSQSVCQSARKLII